MDDARREQILQRYSEHSRRLQALATGRTPIKLQADELVPEPEGSPSERAIEVLQLAAEGLTNREIGERLHLSQETVKTHIRGLLSKLQARSRAHAVGIGFRQGILDRTDESGADQE